MKQLKMYLNQTYFFVNVTRKVLIPLISMSIILGCSKQQAEPTPSILKKEDFTMTLNNKQTDLFRIKNGDIAMDITNYGARVVGLYVPDRNGDYKDIVLGFGSIQEYLDANEVFHGAVIGRVANRIDKGKFMLDSIEYILPINNETNQLHGGVDGFHNVVWDVKTLNDSTIVMGYDSPDGEMGYPGNLSVEVTYQLSKDNEWIIEYSAKTDKRTPVMLTNHAFFNFHGKEGGSINDHILKINANQYIEINETLIPTGNLVPVDGTVLDFSKPKTIGTDLPKQSENEQLKNAGGYDFNWPINKAEKGALEFAGYVYEPKHGIKMEVFTEEPVFLFYGGNFMNGSDIGKYGNPLKFRESFCLELQGYPNAVNNENFPSVILSPGENYSTKTIYQFTTEE